MTTDMQDYHVVLIDLKKAADQGIIECVEKPLVGDLRFIAISYRWGELHETTVDTGLGYLATITSFSLSSFKQLCRAMAVERDLQDMQYVWVDAICVDQTNDERRKATIYQMTNIYERANYIVAVPDLHLAHLMPFHRQVIQDTMLHRETIYHLIGGNLDDLAACDVATLDGWQVPRDPKLRHLLLKYTDHFTDGLTQCRHHDKHYDANATLDHIFQTNPHAHTQLKHHHARKMVRRLLHHMGYERTTDLDMLGIEQLHHCDKGDACPLYLFNRDNPDTCDSLHHHRFDALGTWQEKVPQRSAAIRRSLLFLSDLVRDWSTRVWVISEYHIAKRKKTRMKYWFLQLGAQTRKEPPFPSHAVFFDFDFRGRLTSVHGASPGSMASISTDTTLAVHQSNAITQAFHETLQLQLNHQSFLEKMLKSKASRNEDRFHAILPSSEYKDILIDQDQVDRWKVSNLISVKLELYKWMSTTHKLELLFLSTDAKTVEKMCPTFATSDINWPKAAAYPVVMPNGNFDLTNPATIQLMHQNTLHLKPFGYFRKKGHFQKNTRKVLLKDRPNVERLLQLDLEHDRLDMICIPNYSLLDTTPQAPAYICLIGCFWKRRWMLKDYHRQGGLLENDDKWEKMLLTEDSPAFVIY